MSSATTPKSDLFQTAKAVLIMSLFAMVFILIVVVKDNITGFVCNDARLAGICSMLTSPPVHTNSDQFVASTINLACVGAQGLQISVVFDKPLEGAANVQVFTTGEDVFPTEKGMSDSFETSLAIPAPTNHLDIVIPVESMPVGEQIFGNIVTKQDQAISSYLTYFLKTSDCSISNATLPDPALLTGNGDIPTNYNVTCLPNNRLMVAFEFDDPVQGQYQALIAGGPYQLASVGNQPAILFFSGDLPADGPIVIKLISATDQVVVFEETHTPPACKSD